VQTIKLVVLVLTEWLNVVLARCRFRCFFVVFISVLFISLFFIGRYCLCSKTAACYSFNCSVLLGLFSLQLILL